MQSIGFLPQRNIEQSNATASKAAKRSDAWEAVKQAETKFSSKRKCVELEEETCHKHTKAIALTTPTFTHHTTMHENNMNWGDYVQVSEDCSPGKSSHGGTGFIVDMQGDGKDRTFTVKYDQSALDGGKTKWNIGHSHISGIPMPCTTKNEMRPTCSHLITLRTFPIAVNH